MHSAVSIPRSPWFRYHGLIPGGIALVWMACFYLCLRPTIDLGYYLPVGFLFLMFVALAHVVHATGMPSYLMPVLSLALLASLLVLYLSPWRAMYYNEPGITRRTSVFVVLTLGAYTILLLSLRS